jgi:hypothetical protein
MHHLDIGGQPGTGDGQPGTGSERTDTGSLKGNPLFVVDFLIS